MKELPKPREIQLDNFLIEVLMLDAIHDPNNFKPNGWQLNATSTWWRVKGTNKWLNSKIPKKDISLIEIIDFLTNELQTYVDAYRDIQIKHPDVQGL
jgi:hypothetical protein